MVHARLALLVASGCIANAPPAFVRPSQSSSTAAPSTSPSQVTTQLDGWPMPPPPPEGSRLCAKPGRPLIYCSDDNGYDIFGLPADYAKRAATAWGWSRVRVVEESNLGPGCAIGMVCRANYHIENSANGDVFTIYILAPAPLTAPPSE